MKHIFNKEDYLKRGLLKIVFTWLLSAFAYFVLLLPYANSTEIWVLVVCLILLPVNCIYITIEFFHTLYTYKRSFVLTEDGNVMYHCHLAWRKSRHEQSVEYHICAVTTVIVSVFNNVEVKGRIEAVFLGSDNEKELKRRTIKRLVIPGYFDNMEEIGRVLSNQYLREL